MNIEIIEQEKDARYTVNGKAVWRDMDGLWKDQPELTRKEKQFFSHFLTICISG